MGTGRTFNKDPISRPKKKTRDKARRIRTHAKRLMELGVSEEQIKKMNPPDMRELLRKPGQIAPAK